MGNRRQSREIAFQLLYALELSGDSKDLVKNRFENFKKEHKEEVWLYGERLFEWTFSLMSEIDEQLKKVISNWSIDRLSLIDKNLIRLGCAEMKKGGIPVNIVINEIVEISKIYGEKDSSTFINGVLDSWYKEFYSC